MKRLASKKSLGWVLALGLFAGTTVGCTGHFRLTKKVHTWQTGFENKWAAEGVFLGCVILPVYGLCMLGDGLIFNSMEFWGGNNPFAESAPAK